MSFEIDGYLGKDIKTIIDENYNKHKELFVFCEELNRFSYSILKIINIDLYDIKGLIAASIYLKIQNAYQGSIIMYKYGLDEESKMIARSALEAYFILRAIIENEEFYKSFIELGKKKKKVDLLKKIKKNPHNVFDDLQNPDLFGDFDNLIQQIKGIKDYKISDIAKMSESYAEYYYAYATLSNSVHTNISSIENKFFIVEDNEISALNNAPSTNDIEKIFYTICLLIINSIECMNVYCKLNIDSEIELYSENMIKIFKIEKPNKI